MFCGKCGANLPEGIGFCTNCGAPTGAAAQQPQQPQQPVYQQPVYQQPQQPVYQQPVYQQPQQPGYQHTIQPELPMKWFKFLIYFALIFGALINLGQAVMFFNGTMYDPYTEEVYEEFEDLQTLDMCMGAMLIGVAVLQICSRFALAGYRKSGPVLLNATYAAAAAMNLIYYVAVMAVLPSEATKYLDSSSLFSSIAMGIAMIAANTKYFKNRAHLFTR